MPSNYKVVPLLVAGLVVVALAGCSSSKSSTSTTSGAQGAGGGVTVTTTATSGGPTVVNVVGGEKSAGKYYLTVTPASVKAGPTTITFKTKSTTIDLKPGNYVLVCNIERHYEKGMRTAFTVT